MWKFINTNISSTKNKSKKKIQSIKVDNVEKNDKRDIADTFNKYYANVAKEITKNIRFDNNKSINKKYITESCFLEPTCSFEIETIINKLKDKVTPGYDKISNELIKNIKDYISIPLAHIFNLAIEKNIYPMQFKLAVIIPVYKSGDQKLCSNYRSIALTSNLSKIYEKLIKIRLTKFLTKQKIISKRQYGFRDDASTSDAISYITNYLYDNLDNSNKIAAIFLDLRKAFDLVNHKILLDRMENLGIRGNVNAFFQNYLSNRKQIVRIDDVFSEQETIECGVLQGSVLGPLLFLIYINEMIDLYPDEIVAFADDTTVLCKAKNWDEVEIIANIRINQINNWLSQNKLILNSEKTVFITFSNYKNKQPINFQINIAGNSINKVKHTRFLGIIIDSHLK